MINKQKKQPFDFRQMFKTLGVVTLAFLILHNVTNLMVSVSEAIPENVSSWFPVILAVGVILFLIVYGIHFAEKHSKP